MEGALGSHGDGALRDVEGNVEGGGRGGGAFRGRVGDAFRGIMEGCS